MQTNQAAVLSNGQPSQAPQQDDSYAGEYLVIVDVESGVTIMQELDELVLNMSIE